MMERFGLCCEHSQSVISLLIETGGAALIRSPKEKVLLLCTL
jgi:hypothetical protein